MKSIDKERSKLASGLGPESQLGCSLQRRNLPPVLRFVLRQVMDHPLRRDGMSGARPDAPKLFGCHSREYAVREAPGCVETLDMAGQRLPGNIDEAATFVANSGRYPRRDLIRETAEAEDIDADPLHLGRRNVVQQCADAMSALDGPPVDCGHWETSEDVLGPTPHVIECPESTCHRGGRTAQGWHVEWCVVLSHA
jgi:hypothetical protein